MQALKDLANLLYPPVCVLCRRSEPVSISPPAGSNLFCEACRQTMVRCQAPVCQQCGLAVAAAFDAVVKCRECRNHPRSFTMARAPWQYIGSLQQAIHQLKYAQRWRLGNWLAQDMIRVAQETLPIEQIDLVCPIPSHWLRRRLRGFDPTSTLARLVAQQINKPYLPKAITRTRWTRSQTQLSGPKRLRTVNQVFCANKALVNGRVILLIDDVLTSGATAESCSGALRAAGAREVFVLTAARTPLN